MSLNWKSFCVEITSFNCQILRRIFQFVLVSPHFPIFPSANTWECILVISTNYYQSSNQSVANPHQYLPSRSSWMRGMKRTAKIDPEIVCTIVTVLFYYIGNSRSEFQITYHWYFRTNLDFITKSSRLEYVLSGPEGCLYSNNWTKASLPHQLWLFSVHHLFNIGVIYV